jgi:MATE family multidrug resistance protein
MVAALRGTQAMIPASPPTAPVRHSFFGTAWSIARLALPVTATRAGLLIMITVDTVMVGRTGTTELAYFAVAFPPQSVGFVVTIVLLSASAVLAGQERGAGRPEQCGHIWRIAMIVGASLGVLIGALFQSGAWLLSALGQAPDVAEGGGRALAIWGLSMPGIAIYGATTVFLEVLGRPLPGLVIVVLGNAVNAALCWVLIHGDWGAPAMGGSGAVTATAIVRWLMAAAIVAYALNMRDARHWGVYRPLGSLSAGVTRLLRLGLPLSAASLIEISAFFAFATFSGWLGLVALAAYQIALNIMSTIYMAAIGISIATSVHVSIAAGRGRVDEIAHAGWAGVAVLAVVMAVATFLFLALAPAIFALYTADPALIALLGALALLIAAIFFVDGLQMVLLSATRAIADVTVPAIIFLVAFGGVAIPLGYALGPGGGAVALIEGDALTLGVGGILIAALISLTLASALLALRFAWLSRRAR